MCRALFSDSIFFQHSRSHHQLANVAHRVFSSMKYQQNSYLLQPAA